MVNSPLDTVRHVLSLPTQPLMFPVNLSHARAKNVWFRLIILRRLSTEPVSAAEDGFVGERTSGPSLLFVRPEEGKTATDDRSDDCLLDRRGEKSCMLRPSGNTPSNIMATTLPASNPSMYAIWIAFIHLFERFDLECFVLTLIFVAALVSWPVALPRRVVTFIVRIFPGIKIPGIGPVEGKLLLSCRFIPFHPRRVMPVRLTLDQLGRR